MISTYLRMMKVWTGRRGSKGGACKLCTPEIQPREVHVCGRFLKSLRARVHSPQLRAYQLRTSEICRSLLLICILRPVCACLAANGFTGSTQIAVVLDIVRRPHGCSNFHKYLSRAEPARHLLGRNLADGKKQGR